MIEPMRDFVVVQKDEAPEKTAGGLYIGHADVEEKIVFGTVLAVGSGLVCSNGDVVAPELKVGDRVAFNKSMAVEVKDKEVKYLLVREENVMCKFVS